MTGLFQAGKFEFSKKLLIQFVIPVWPKTILAEMGSVLKCILVALSRAGAIVVAQKLLIQAETPSRYCSNGNRSKTALRACSSSGLEKVSSLHLVFLLSSEDPWPWDPRDPVAVEPLPCPSKFREFSEPEPLETEVAFVSNVVTRAARSISVLCRNTCQNSAVFFDVNNKFSLLQR